MPRVLYSGGAGPGFSGFAPQSASTLPLLTTTVADQRSLSIPQPLILGTALSRFETLNFPAPALNPLTASVAQTISNRHMRRLEITATPMESTGSLFLIVPNRILSQSYFHVPISNVASVGTIWAPQLVEVEPVAHNGIRPLFAA